VLLSSPYFTQSRWSLNSAPVPVDYTYGCEMGLLETALITSLLLGGALLYSSQGLVLTHAPG
jgi:hypothetical protein